MSSTNELIKALYDKRRNLIEQQRELHTQIEGNLDGEGNAEAQAKWEALDKEQDDLRQRIDNMVTMLESEKEMSAQRERFEQLTTFQTNETVEQSFDQRMRTWLRASLPDAEVWAPKSIEVHLEQHTLSELTGAAGQFTVPTGFVNTLQEHLIEFAAVRKTNAQVFRTNSGENLLVPKTTGHGAAVLVTEGAALSASDSVFAQVTLGAYKFGQIIQVSTELITDTAVDLLGYLGRAVGIAIGTVTGTYYVTGTGTSQPQGIANAATTGILSTNTAANLFKSSELIDLYHSIVTGYRGRGTWMMNDLIAAFVRKMRDDTGGAGVGNFLWQPGMQAGQPDTLFGRPVITDTNIASSGVNAFVVAFGDFSAYFAIRDVNAIRFERSDDYAFANDLVSFRALLRSDSKQLINGAAGAVKWLKLAAA